MSALFAGFVVGCLYAKRLVGGVGHVRTFAGLAGVSAVTVLIYPLAVSVPVWALLLGTLTYRALRRPRVPQEQSFVDVPPASPAAPQLDPRHR